LKRKPSAPREGKAPSQRQLRVGEALRHILADYLERTAFDDPRLKGRVITVSEVRVSPDLTNATAFVMPLGGEGLDEVVAGLNAASGLMRRQVAQRVDLRVAPRLTFAADHAFDRANRVDDLLRRPRVLRDLEAEPGDDWKDEDYEPTP